LISRPTSYLAVPYSLHRNYKKMF